MKEFEIGLYDVLETLIEKLKLLEKGGINYLPKMSQVILDEEKIVGKNKKADLLKLLEEKITGCKKCPLCSKRTNIVFGQGSPDAKLIFVGEAPGEQEDIQGLPFVGRAGLLLDKMIQAMGFKREEVYICNVVKCRPPKNREPAPEEIDECKPILLEQISIIKPKVIVGLGRYACQTLLNTKASMSSIRGVWQEFEGIKFMPTFHPAYLLRNPPAKKEVWEDLQKVMKFLSKD